ncbi:MAG: hypothetical protein ACK5LY_06040 [Lachnospirales bacterium]
MSLFSKITNYAKFSIIRKLRIMNILVLTVVFVIFTVVIGISTLGFFNDISSLYTNYNVSKVRSIIETDINQEIYYMNSLASSKRLIEWFQNSNDEELARNVIDENKVVFSNLLEKKLVFNLVKEERSIQVSGYTLNFDELAIEELAYSKEDMDENNAIISSSPNTYYLKMSSNALTGENSIWFTTAVYDNTEFLGTLSFEVDFDKITSRIKDINSEVSKIYIADESGYLVTSSIVGYDYIWNFESINMLDRLGSKEFKQYYNNLVSVKNTFENNEEVTSFKTSYIFLEDDQPVDVLVTALPIKNTPWNLICITDIDTFSSFWNSTNIFIYVFIIFIVFYILVLYFTEILFKRPIYTFLESLKGFKEDKSTYLYGINNKDELGYIANVFFETSNKLVENNLELEHIISKRTYELKMKTYDFEHSEKRIEKFLEGSLFAILTYSGEGEILNCNKKSIEIFAVKDRNEILDILQKNPSSILYDLDIKKVFLSDKKDSLDPLRAILKTSFGKVFLADIYCYYTSSTKSSNFDVYDIVIAAVDEFDDEEDDIFKPKERVYSPEQEVIVINPMEIKGHIAELNKESDIETEEVSSEETDIDNK